MLKWISTFWNKKVYNHLKHGLEKSIFSKQKEMKEEKIHNKKSDKVEK